MSLPANGAGMIVIVMMTVIVVIMPEIGAGWIMFIVAAA